MTNNHHAALWGRRVWHITPIENLESILSKGLVPAAGPRSAQLGETDEAIYCFDSPDDLEDALTNWLGETFDDGQVLALLEIEVPQNAVVGEGAGFEVVIRSPIPVGAIEILSHDVDGFDVGQIRPASVNGPEPV